MKLLIKVKIGKRGEIFGWDGDTLHVVVNAAPVDGASNRRLIEIISDWAKVNKGKIIILKGLTNRYKTLDIDAEQDYIDELIAKLPRIAKQESLF
jgi:uncharacterized protein YggU (UPF0235/DUF167 family)